MIKLKNNYVTDEYAEAINKAISERKTEDGKPLTKSIFMRDNELPMSFSNWSCGNKPNEKNAEAWIKLIAEKLGV